MAEEIEMEVEVATPVKMADGHWTIKTEKKKRKYTLYYTDRHRLHCNMCVNPNYPECRKDCQADIWWREENGITF